MLFDAFFKLLAVMSAARGLRLTVVPRGAARGVCLTVVLVPFVGTGGRSLICTKVEPLDELSAEVLRAICGAMAIGADRTSLSCPLRCVTMIFKGRNIQDSSKIWYQTTINSLVPIQSVENAPPVCVDKGYPQGLSTRAVHNDYPQGLSTRAVHNAT